MMLSLDDVKEAATWLPFVGLTQRARSDGTVQQAEQRMRHLETKISELQEDTKEIRQQLRLAEQELWRRNGLDKMHLVRMP